MENKKEESYSFEGDKTNDIIVKLLIEILAHQHYTLINLMNANPDLQPSKQELSDTLTNLKKMILELLYKDFGKIDMNDLKK